MSDVVWIDLDVVDGVVFDLDGVLSSTATLHAAAWQALFEPFLAGVGVAPYDPGVDYPLHLDGRLRQDGVAAVLGARGLTLPLGTPDDPAGTSTLWALANRKQEHFLALLGDPDRLLRPLPGTFELVRALRRAGARAAVVSASRNTEAVLARAGLDSFDVRVDGIDAAALGLAGKPDPAMFLHAATLLRLPPTRLVVVEDAVAGVQAAIAGGFSVIGVAADEHHAAELRAAGASDVVADLSGIEVRTRDVCCSMDSPEGRSWVIAFASGGDEARRESLCTLGNGYLGSRGAVPEGVANGGLHYPGTYVAGVYNRLVTNVHGRELEHEDLVNLPNWLPLTFRLGEGEWFGAPCWAVLGERHELDVRHGVLTRWVTARDPQGFVVEVRQRRIVSIQQPHLAALEMTLCVSSTESADDERAELPPRARSIRVEVRSALDGRITNAGVRDYRALADRHLEGVDTDIVDTRTLVMRAWTAQSKVGVAVAARTSVMPASGGRPPVTHRHVHHGAGWIAHVIGFDVAVDDPDAPQMVVEKVVAIHTSRDAAITEPGEAAVHDVHHAGTFAALLADHRAAWERQWERAELWIDADGRTPAVVNLHVFHLLQALSPRHNLDVDAGVTARGLSGEAYRGHVFWDELFIQPYFTLRFPDLARALLLYRYRRLDRARELARAAGHRGAMFPWQSGSDGREETPVQFFNLRSGRWMADNSCRQRHVSLAVAFNVCQYVQSTGDLAFLRNYGAEMLIEIARFWAGIARYDPDRDRFDIDGVMGPDEFHDGYPGRPGEGLTNNAYTNVMASWLLRRAAGAVAKLADLHGGEVRDRLGVHADELERWEEVGRKLTVPFDGAGRLAQFEGYDALIELDWDRYREKYGNIGRLDLILEAEGDTTNRYKLSKQADVLMLFYLFSAEQLGALLDHLGYSFDPATIPDTVRYYLARTSHGSTLGRVAHAWVLARSDRHESWQLFLDALASDIDDTQGGTTGEGLHLGAMAGTVDLLQRCYTGLELERDGLRLNPRLPAQLNRLRFEVAAWGHRLTLDVNHERVTVRSRLCDAPPLRIVVGERSELVVPGQLVAFPLAEPECVKAGTAG